MKKTLVDLFEKSVKNIRLILFYGRRQRIGLNLLPIPK